jgi:hypothetical protein
MNELTARPIFDERDAAILAARQVALDANTGPRVGDFVIFADDIMRRISHIWKFDADDSGPAIHDVQTSDGGSWYLAEGYCSFSGTLYRSVGASTLTDTGETSEGSVWFFHHDFSQAHNGVIARARFRVYRCSEKAPR